MMIVMKITNFAESFTKIYFNLITSKMLLDITKVMTL